MTKQRKALAFVIVVAVMLSVAGGTAYSLPAAEAASAIPAAGSPAFPGDAASHHTFLPLLGVAPRRPSSEELIEQALADGEIDEETALVYKVYAAFADDRLPDLYRGDDSRVRDSAVMRRAVEGFEALSPEAQAILRPFLLPPSAPGSWLELRESGHTKSSGDDRPDLDGEAAPGQQAIQWGKVVAVEGKVKVWYQERHSDTDLINALWLSDRIELDIYPKLQGLMQRPLLSDAAYPHHGDDGALDIYLVHNLGAMGQTISYGSCARVPSFVQIDTTKGGQQYTLAHEMMHVHQFLFNFCGKDTDWLGEATAVWAEDHVYPGGQSEHEFADNYFWDTERPLEQGGLDRQYGAYVFFFFLTRALGDPGLIATIWQDGESRDSLEAVNTAIPGGFASAWSDFAIRNWNEPPEDSYRRWDALTKKAQVTEATSVLRPGKLEIDLSGGIEHLAIEYYRFYFPADNARMVYFFNGLNYELSEEEIDETVDAIQIRDGSRVYDWSPVTDESQEGAEVQALFKIEGDQQWRVEDWTEKPVVSFCRDSTAERIEDLVIVFSNHKHEPRDNRAEPQELNPILYASNIGCWKWEGESEFVGDIEADGEVHGEYTVKIENAIWERQQQQEEGSYPYVNYELTQGAWSMTWDWTDPNCTGSGSGSGALDPAIGVMHTFQGVLSGPSSRRYQGMAVSTAEVTEHKVCYYGGHRYDSYRIIPGLLDWFKSLSNMIPGGMIPQVKEDGVTIEDSVEEEYWTEEWRFEAKRE